LNDLTSYMDPFFGNGTIDLPEPQGIAATWFFIKAQTGNTHPGACAPFGMMSVCAYSGAYPTGYGLNAPNTHATPPRCHDRLLASGFAHLQQSGTGAIGSYYNYVRVTPLADASSAGDLAQLGALWPLEEEQARPGYYAATLGGAGIRAELVATSRVALHRYSFAQAPAHMGAPRVIVDCSNGGLQFPNRRTIPTEAEIAVVSPRAAQGFIVMEGLPIYFHVECDLDGGAVLWRGNREWIAQERLSLPHIAEQGFSPFGVAFGGASKTPTVAEVRVGLSMRGVERARQYVDQVRDKAFDRVAHETRRAWNAYANRVQVSGGTEAQREVFYSSLYHSGIKPADWCAESPYWDDTSPSGDAFYVDFATMWDQYKTQLPLLLSLYPEHGRGAINSLLALAEHAGRFPNGFILNADLDQFDNQARSLAHMAIADAYYRRLEGVDWHRALNVMLADLRHERNDDFFTKGLVYPVTHTLDLAQACHCMAQIARGLGEAAVYAERMDHSARWRNAYDRGTGRLIEAEYYEGGLWNYSFRLLHDMAGRIALYPSEADYIADLDCFFGYGQPPVIQPAVPGDRAYMRWGHSLNRFEGYNNEPDIETPYGYLYAGRHDRAAEVVRAGMRYMYTTGRGGLPGNNDSGGLTSCYVWNAVGLFPVTGQPIYLIGSPIFDAASLQLGDKTFTVEARNNSTENIYVQSATLNGRVLDRAYLGVEEVHRGGTLTLEMGPKPSGWASEHRPPSYPPKEL
jgi:putative alpha-1,2-mannosidase